MFFLYVLVGRCWVYITMPATKAKLKKNIVSKTPISSSIFLGSREPLTGFERPLVEKKFLYLKKKLQ